MPLVPRPGHRCVMTRPIVRRWWFNGTYPGRSRISSEALGRADDTASFAKRDDGSAESSCRSVRPPVDVRQRSVACASRFLLYTCFALGKLTRSVVLEPAGGAWSNLSLQWPRASLPCLPVHSLPCAGSRDLSKREY